MPSALTTGAEPGSSNRYRFDCSRSGASAFIQNIESGLDNGSNIRSFIESFQIIFMAWLTPKRTILQTWQQWAQRIWFIVFADFIHAVWWLVWKICQYVRFSGFQKLEYQSLFQLSKIAARKWAWLLQKSCKKPKKNHPPNQGWLRADVFPHHPAIFIAKIDDVHQILIVFCYMWCISTIFKCSGSFL